MLPRIPWVLSWTSPWFPELLSVDVRATLLTHKQTNKQTDPAGLKRQPWWKWGMEEQYFLALSCLFTVAVAHTVSFESRRRRRERSRRAVARRCLAYFSLWARAELPPVFPHTYSHGDQTAHTVEKARGSNTLPHWINNATAHSKGKLDKHARPQLIVKIWDIQVWIDSQCTSADQQALSFLSVRCMKDAWQSSRHHTWQRRNNFC